MDRRRSIAAGLSACGLLIAMTTAVAADGEIKVTGRVVDAGGKPVAGAEVASHWGVGEEDGQQKGFASVKTDGEGRFATPMSFYGRDSVLMAMDAEGRSGGLAVITPAEAEARKPVEIRLGPLVKVTGKMVSPDLGRPIPWTNVYMKLQPGKISLVGSPSRKAEFSAWVPAGEYQVYAYGSDVTQAVRTIRVEGDRPEIDLGTLEIPATPIAKLVGRSLPPWTLADARGVPKGVSLDDYKGKWVLVDFWGYWCGPCVQQLAELIDFYELHAEHRDQFEILAFHDGSVKDLAEMDEKTAATKRGLWGGRDLPFPILLDAPKGDHGVTVEAYGIQAFPTSLLIDPEGKLVGPTVLQVLEQKLPAIPMARRLPRALDRQVALGLQGGSVGKLAEFLGQRIRIPLKLDTDALKTSGIDPETASVPLTMSGTVSARSWLELLLDPLGLEAVPGDEGLTLTTKKSGAPAREPSKVQREVAARIEEKLRQPVTFDFRDASLWEVAARLEQQAQENFVIDPAGLLSGVIDREATITGRAKDVPLRQALENLLKPLGLKLLVKDEVIVLTRSGE